MRRSGTRAEGSIVVVIAGFMGTGKTVVGRAVADMLGLDFVDTDAEIESTTGMTVAEIFERHGEPHFRKLEAELSLALAKPRDVVIATGGGMLLDDDIFDRFSEMGDIILLETSIDELCRRLAGDGSRPVLGMSTPSADALKTRITKLIDQRSRTYGRIATRFDTTGAVPEAVASRIVACVTPQPHRVEVTLVPPADGGEEPTGRVGRSLVEIGRGSISTIGQRLHDTGIGTQAFIVAPRIVLDAIETQLTASLDDASIPHTTIEIQDGDENKTLARVSMLIDRLIESGAKRDSTIIAAGGGVTGDLVGFAASVFMRGVPLVHVPTTLLAQVDSSVGAKVGVNHLMAKNMIGSFYQPHLVLSDPCVLRTLPREEVSNGMAEVVKSALIGSRDFFEYLEASVDHDATVVLRDAEFLERCILESVAIKARIVNSDPFERNERRILNLGHTVGHAIEAAAGYRGLKHGEAVSLGLVATLRIAQIRSAIPAEIADRAVRLLSWCMLPVSFGDYDRDAMTRGLRLDKKIRNRRLNFVLPTGIGSVKIVDDVTVDEILETIQKGP